MLHLILVDRVHGQYTHRLLGGDLATLGSSAGRAAISLSRAHPSPPMPGLTEAMRGLRLWLTQRSTPARLLS